MIRVATHKDTNRESGMVSLFVTLIMLAVITLIVIGFTQVANRNRRQALDRQLSTQAFYAAESGVNQAVTYIKNLPVGTTEPAKTNCGTGSYGFADGKLKTDGTSTSVETTCLLVNGYPSDIQGTASVGTPVVLPIAAVDVNGNAIKLQSLKIIWTSPSASPSATGCSSALGTFTTSYAASCTYGLLRIDLIVYTRGNTTDLTSADAMINKTVTLYLQPRNVATANPDVDISNVASKQAYIMGGSCDGSACTATFNIPTDEFHAYYARLTTLYNNAPAVDIKGVGVGGVSTNFAGQYLIDATGRAQDVLRRIAVRYNPMSGTSTPDPLGAIQTPGGVCKLLTVVSSTVVQNDAAKCTP